MNSKISCPECGAPAAPKTAVLTRPDGKWLHHDCSNGDHFHRTIAGNPVAFTECDCDPRGPKGA